MANTKQKPAVRKKTQNMKNAPAAALNPAVKVLFNVLMMAITFAFLLCLATWIILLLKPLYYLMVHTMNITESSGQTYEVCCRNYDAMVDYNLLWGPKILSFPDFVMSAGGAIHFREVKTIFVAMQITAIAALPFVVGGYVLSKKVREFFWLKGTIFLTAAVILFIGGAFAVNWEGAFVAFHRLMFDNDYWLFDSATDPVITILPDGVFLVLGIGILVLMAAGLLACGLLYRKNRRQYGLSPARK